MYAFVPRSSTFAPIDIRPAGSRSHARPSVVRERESRYETGDGRRHYESEGSERRTLGSVAVTDDARWIATLTVPIPDRNAAFVELERRGDLPEGYRGSEEVAYFSLPPGELDALVALLTGVVDQARHDGVLPPRHTAMGE